MRRAAVVVAVVAGAYLAPAPAGAATPLVHACRYGHALRWDTVAVQRTIRCAVARWSVPGGAAYALAIARRESGYRQYAHNPSGCSGIYQWAGGTWASVQRMFPGVYRAVSWHSVWSARGNILYAIRYAHQYGWGPWAL